MSEKDQRQYSLMLEKIRSFEQGRIYLGSLVDDLDSLLNVLEAPDPSWKEAFLHEWGNLEDERAYALFKNEKEFNKDAMRRINLATGQLKLLVLQNLD